MWALSNITAASERHVKILLENEVFVQICEIALNTQVLDNRKEALWVICNAITSSYERAALEILDVT